MEVIEGAAPAATDDRATEGPPLDSDAIFQEALGEAAEPPTEAEADITPQELEIGGRKFSLPDLEELVKAGEDAKETKAEATRKFQEAAEIRKSVEDLQRLKEAWDSGDPVARRKIAQFFQEESGVAAETPTQDVTAPKWDSMTTEEQFLYKQNLDLKSELAQLRAAITPVLEETKGFLGATKAEKQAAADATTIKAQFGIELAPSQVLEMREKGVDPVAAAQMGLLKPAAPVEKKPDIPPGPPAKRDRVYDSRKLSGDEIAYLAAQGWTDIADAS